MNGSDNRFSRRQLLAAGLAATLPGWWGSAQAQGWPSKPLRLVVPFAPGGASDTLARIVSDHLPSRLGQPVVIENKPGASTIIGVDAVAKSPADGYTLLLAGVGSFSVLPAVRKNLPFNIDRDFSMLALISFAPNILVTSIDKPYKNLPDFVKAAKTQPGQLRYATYGDGSANHLCGVMLENAAGIRLDPIPFKGAADAKLALLRGDVDLSFETLTSVAGELKGNRLRALASGSPARSKLLPDLPSFGELGYVQAAAQPLFGLAVHSATPAPVRDRLSKEILEIMALPAVRERAIATSLEPVALGPAEMKEIVARETENYRRVAQQLKLQLD